MWPRTKGPCNPLSASSRYLAQRWNATPQVVSQGKDLEDYDPADIAMALCRMVSYNIGHLAYLNAKRYGLPRVFFGGFFIRGHPYTMETISFAIRFWSKACPHCTRLRCSWMELRCLWQGCCCTRQHGRFY